MALASDCAQAELGYSRGQSPDVLFTKRTHFCPAFQRKLTSSIYGNHNLQVSTAAIGSTPQTNAPRLVALADFTRLNPKSGKVSLMLTLFAR